MGCVFKPNPRCQFYYVRYKTLSGAWVTESSRSARKEDAKTFLRSKEGEIVKGVNITPEVGRLTFDGAVADLVTDYKIYRRRSLDELERRVRLHLRPHFGGKRMALISPADVTAYILKRQADTIVVQHERTIRTRKGVQHLPEIRKPVSNAEINRELTILKRLYSLAIKNRKLMDKPAIDMLPESDARQGCFERDEIDALCEHLPPEIQTVVRFGFITGWRVSEILQLTWDRVDFAGRGSVRLAKGTTKNGEARRFYMTAELRQLLEAQWSEHQRLLTEDRICPVVFHRNGEPIKSFIKVWRTACRRAGCPGRIPHDLRRSAIRMFVRSGISENTAMALSGHKTPSVFRRYDIVTDDDLNLAAEQLDAAKLTTDDRRPAKIRTFAPRS